MKADDPAASTIAVSGSVRPRQFLLVDSMGVILSHLGARDQGFQGQHYRSLLDLPRQCRLAVDELLEPSDARGRQLDDACRVVDVDGELVEVRILEVLRVARIEFPLKRSLSEWLFGTAQRAFEANIRLVIKTAKGVPDKVLVDPEKILWVIHSIVQNALHSVPRGSFFRHGGKVEVAISYEAGPGLFCISVEDDGGHRLEQSLDAPSFHGPSGRINGAAKFARQIIEGHGGIMLWQGVKGVNGCIQGTKVALSIPVQCPMPAKN